MRPVDKDTLAVRSREEGVAGAWYATDALGIVAYPF
jgi:hypothetical protein